LALGLGVVALCVCSSTQAPSAPGALCRAPTSIIIPPPPSSPGAVDRPHAIAIITNVTAVAVTAVAVTAVYN